MLALGCSGGNEVDLAPVTGIVTLDGKPLPDAMVSFYPVNEGRSSHATTNGAGEYRLQYTGTKEGALVGKHTVKIETGVITGEGEAASAKNTPKLNPIYNELSELTGEVKSESNVINFELKSQSTTPP